MPDNELQSIDPGVQQPPGTGFPGAELVPPTASVPGVNPAAAVVPPTLPAQVPGAPAESPLDRAHRLAATDSSQLTQADMTLLAAEDLANQNALAAGRGGPTHSVKVGESQSATTQRTKVGAEAKAADSAVQGTFAERANAVQAQVTAQQAELAAKAAMQERQAQELAADNARKAEAEAARQQRMQQLEAEQSRLAADVAKEARSIDPDRWLHQSMGRTIGASLAAALGAYGATLGKTPNFALQIINDAIDRDFQGQKLQLQAKQDQQSMQARVIDRTRALFGDQRAADLAARANMLEVHKAQVEALGTKYRGTQVEANAKEAVALIDQEAAKYRSQAAHLEDVHQSNTSTSQLATVDASGNPAGAGNGKSVIPLTAYNVNKRAAELAAENKKGGFLGEADSPQQRQQTKDALNQFAAFNSMLNTSLPALKKAVKDREVVGAGPFSAQNPLGTASQDVSQILGTVAADYTKAVSGAQASEPEMKRHQRNIMPGEREGGNGVFGGISAARQLRGVDTYIGLGAAKMRAVYDALTPAGKQAILNAAGGDRARLERMLSGQPAETWIDNGKRLGGEDHVGP